MISTIFQLTYNLGENLQCPLLCKEFIIDPWQIYYARLKGADAVLLIAGVLTDLDIKLMIMVCKKLGMVALVEVCDSALHFLLTSCPDLCHL